MTTTGEPLVLRPPGWARVLGPVFLVAWLSAFLFPDGAWGAFLVPGVVIALIAAAVVGRLLCASVIGTGDGRLVVRNLWSTRTFTRHEIDGVGIDRAGRRGWAVWLVLGDGSHHRLDVTEAPFLGPSSAVLERQADAVRGWLDGRQQAVL